MREIEKLLTETGRENINFLLCHMRDNGYYTAPCSGSHHLATVGGLAEHSLNVCNTALKLWHALEADVPVESVVIAALLHDLGKIGDHGKALYVDNILKSGKVSDAKPFKHNEDILQVPHEVRSVAIAERYIELTEDEEYAILNHNGLYGDFRYEISGNETPLYMLIHFADMWASRVLEV